ncbi:MAG: dihydroorotate dehydrogenase [Bacteroidetes bacterium]|nr:dihydroorotate dehydrogenase [Bacteroidota bacterium]
MLIESFKIGNVNFKNRVFVASGTFGYGNDVNSLVDVNKLGAIFTKSLSLKPRDGNPSPRIVETSSGMLNSIGLANIGVQKFINEKIPLLKNLNVNIIANIAASSLKEYCLVVEKLNPFETVKGFEINISCPNVKDGGLLFGTDIKLVEKLTMKLRSLTKKPLIIKLTPNVTFISEYARAAENSGADAVSVINTLVGMAINYKTRKPKISTITGGLSGPAIKPIALAKVYETAKAVKIPVIGIGGIMNWIDAIEFFIAGASAIQVGTANYINPSTGVGIADGIVKYCNQLKLKNINQLVGSLEVGKSSSVIDSWL